MPTLEVEDCRERFGRARHAVLATLHEVRGPDLVPVVFGLTVTGGRDTLIVPVDHVKAKATTELARLVNIDADPRVSLLVEHYDDDWRSLWWVRATGRARRSPSTPDMHRVLADRYDQYDDPATIASCMVVDVSAWRGWTAT